MINRISRIIRMNKRRGDGGESKRRREIVALSDGMECGDGGVREKGKAKGGEETHKYTKLKHTHTHTINKHTNKHTLDTNTDTLDTNTRTHNNTTHTHTLSLTLNNSRLFIQCRQEKKKTLQNTQKHTNKHTNTHTLQTIIPRTSTHNHTHTQRRHTNTP